MYAHLSACGRSAPPPRPPPPGQPAQDCDSGRELLGLSPTLTLEGQPGGMRTPHSLYFTRGCCPRASHHVPVWKASRQNPLAPVDHSVFLPAGLEVRRHLHDGVILLGDASEVAVPCASKGPVQRGVSGLFLCLESFLQQRCLNTSSALPLPGLCWRAVPPRPGFPHLCLPPDAWPLAPPPLPSHPPASPPSGRSSGALGTLRLTPRFQSPFLPEFGLFPLAVFAHFHPQVLNF